MAVADPHRLILTGENPFIRLSEKDGDPNSTDASYWRILFCPAGPGHVLYLKSELTQNQWRIYSDNIAMTRWLQQTVQGMLNAELKNVDIPVIDASFTKSGDPRYFWTEHIKAHEADYDFFIFFSFRYHHSYHGARALPSKAILVPTAERDSAGCQAMSGREAWSEISPWTSDQSDCFASSSSPRRRFVSASRTSGVESRCSTFAYDGSTGAPSGRATDISRKCVGLARQKPITA